MLLDFRNPESIAAWVRVRPAEHWQQIRAIVKLRPQWREPARRAQALLRKSMQEAAVDH